MSHYWVTSPEMQFTIPVMDDGSGPVEPYFDSVCVEARSKRAALRIGVPRLTEWTGQARADGGNPFAGVEVRDARCPHGFCYCDVVGCIVGGSPEGRGCEECEGDEAAT